MILNDVVLKPAHRTRITKQLDSVKQEMLDAPGGLTEIVYVDECVFTYSTELKLAFSNPHENIIADKKQMSMTSMAAVAAISAKRGLIFMKLYPKSVDRWRFIEFC